MRRTDGASGVVAEAPARVYAALVDTAALVEWLPPGGSTGTFERFDPRPGGPYRLVLTFDPASGARGKATADTDVVEATFVEATFVEIVAEDMPSGISAEDHAAGLTSSLDNLAASVTH